MVSTDMEQVRNSYRFTVSGECARAELVIGELKCLATLLDESSGGFRISVSDNLRIVPEQRGTLKTHLGLFEVRVAKVDSKETVKHIGLQRLSDDISAAKDVEKLTLLAGESVHTTRLPTNHRGLLIGAGIVLVGLLLVLPLAFSVGKTSEESVMQQGERRNSPSESSWSKFVTAPLFGQKNENSQPEKSDVQATLEQAQKVATEYKTMVATTVTEFADLVTPETSEKLGLTEDQQNLIRKELSKTLEAMEVLHRKVNLSMSERMERSAQLLEQGEARINSLLTPEQRALWQR